MAAGFISEWWTASNRNGGRLHVGKPGRNKSESASSSVVDFYRSEENHSRRFPSHGVFTQPGSFATGSSHSKSDHVRYGADSRSKFRSYPVARRVRYAAPVVTNEPIEDHPALGEPFERADLIGAH
jgi:hypothetical protein